MVTILNVLKLILKYFLLYLASALKYEFSIFQKKILFKLHDLEATWFNCINYQTRVLSLIYLLSPVIENSTKSLYLNIFCWMISMLFDLTIWASKTVISLAIRILTYINHLVLLMIFFCANSLHIES